MFVCSSGKRNGESNELVGCSKQWPQSPGFALSSKTAKRRRKKLSPSRKQSKKESSNHMLRIFSRSKNEVTIHTLPHLKCIRLVSVRSSHLPFKMLSVGFRAFKSPLYWHRRANRTDLKIQLAQMLFRSLQIAVAYNTLVCITEGWTLILTRKIAAIFGLTLN